MSKRKSNKLPKISIVIPSYNKVEFIGETIKSIVTQDYPNLEVIVQDGGSNDGTLEVIKKYANNYPKLIKWESKRDKGQVDAINKGMKKATGEILAYINADDVYEKNSFREVGESFNLNQGTYWVAGKGIVINKKNREISKGITLFKYFLLRLNTYWFLLIINYLMQPSVFFSSECFKKYGPFRSDKRYVLEYDFWLQVAKDNMPVVIPNVLSKFRFADENISLTQSTELLNSDLQIVKNHTNNRFILSVHGLINNMRIYYAKRFL